MRALMVVVLAVALAGCSQPGLPADGALPGGHSGGGTALRVVVADQALHPIAGATVTLEPGGRTGVTGADGEARFAGLEPGEATVRAEAPGFLPAQATVRLEPGEGPPAVLLLAADTSALRYVHATKTEHVLQASIDAGADGADLPAVSVIEDDDGFSLADGLPDWLQSEASWTPVQPLGDRLELRIWVCPGDAGAVATCTTAVGVPGPSPVHAAAGRQALLDLGYSDGSDVHPGVNAVQPSPGGATVVLQQAVVILSHAFYGFTPPAGWLHSRDGEPPVPA